MLRLRNVGHFGALSCPPATKVATKYEPCENHLPHHFFLGAMCARHGQLLSKTPHYFRGCNTRSDFRGLRQMPGELVKPVS